MLQPFGSCTSTEIIDYFSSTDEIDDANTESLGISESYDDYIPLFF